MTMVTRRELLKISGYAIAAAALAGPLMGEGPGKAVSSSAPVAGAIVTLDGLTYGELIEYREPLSEVRARGRIEQWDSQRLLRQ